MFFCTFFPYSTVKLFAETYLKLYNLKGKKQIFFFANFVCFKEEYLSDPFRKFPNYLAVPKMFLFSFGYDQIICRYFQKFIN